MCAMETCVVLGSSINLDTIQATSHNSSARPQNNLHFPEPCQRLQHAPTHRRWMSHTNWGIHSWAIQPTFDGMETPVCRPQQSWLAWGSSDNRWCRTTDITIPLHSHFFWFFNSLCKIFPQLCFCKLLPLTKLLLARLLALCAHFPPLRAVYKAWQVTNEAPHAPTLDTGRTRVCAK